MYLYVYLKVMGHCPLFYNKLTLGTMTVVRYLMLLVERSLNNIALQ